MCNYIRNISEAGTLCLSSTWTNEGNHGKSHRKRGSRRESIKVAFEGENSELTQLLIVGESWHASTRTGSSYSTLKKVQLAIWLRFLAEQVSRIRGMYFFDRPFQRNNIFVWCSSSDCWGHSPTSLCHHWVVYFLFLVPWGGARLYHLIRWPLFGLLYQPRMVDNECGAVSVMRTGRVNRSTRRKRATVSFCPP
jgi:hypothetical protein